MKPKCVGCNSIAKRRGGLCEACYKRKGNDDKKEDCPVRNENGNDNTACFSEQSLKESGKKYNCIVCLKNGKTKFARHTGSLCRKCRWEKSSLLYKVCNTGAAGSDGMCSVYCRNKHEYDLKYK